MFGRGVFACILCLGLAGCMTGLTSERSADADGAVYYLPESLLQVTVKKYVPPPPTPATAPAQPTAYTVEAQGVSAPDLNHRYVLSYQPNVLYDDRFCIGLDTKGLLSTVQFAAEDKTQQIVFNISRLLAGAGQPRTTSTITRDDVKPIEFKMIINPLRGDDVEAFNNSMRAALDDGSLSLDVGRLKTALGWSPGAANRQVIPCPEDEICYRTMMKVPVDLMRAVPSSNRRSITYAVDYAEMVNPNDMGRVSVKRAMLVERVTKLWFKDGALTTPSDLIAGAFSGDTNFKTKVAQELGQLQGQTTALNSYFSQGPAAPVVPIIGASTSTPGLPADDKALFGVSCAKRSDAVSWLNIPN
jgi:hypothetical protein